MRVVVTGAGGLLGGRLAELLARDGLEVTAVRRRTPAPEGLPERVLELTDAEALIRLLDDVRPDAIVHAAALSRANECEAEPEDAQATNQRLPGRLAELARARGIRLVTLSTDLVFDGRRPWRREDDSTGPLSLYGRTKLAGEEAVLGANPEAALARVSLVAGRGHGPRTTSTESIAQALGAGRPVRLYTDEFRTPVDPTSVAAAVVRLLHGGQRGRFHLGGPERISRFELGRRVARVLGLPTATLVPALRAEHGGKEPRAADVSLDISRARRELQWEPRPLDEAIRESRLEAWRERPG